MDTTKSLKERVKDALNERSYYWKESNGFEYGYQYDAGYDDTIDSKSIKRICESEFPEDEFLDLLYEWYGLAMDEFKNDLIDEFISWMYETDTLSWNEEEEAREWMNDLIYIDPPMDYYRRRNVYVDLTIDTGDANYDFTSNDFEPAYAGRELDNGIPEEASLKWLAETQGYTEKDIIDAFHDFEENGVPEHGFLASVYTELYNSASAINALTILASMTLDDVMILNEKMRECQYKDGSYIYTAQDRPDNGTIHISKDAVIGLFNSWDGGGSLLEIELEKDFDLPIKYIYNAEQDATRGGRWSVQDVYGLIRSEWKEDVVTGICA